MRRKPKPTTTTPSGPPPKPKPPPPVRVFERMMYRKKEYCVDQLGGVWSIDLPTLVGAVENFNKENQRVYLFDYIKKK